LTLIPRDEWHGCGRLLGHRVLVYRCLDSTNSLAAELAHDRSNDGLVILADEQTAGRGRHGRSWSCEPGAGVLASFLLFPAPELRRPVMLAAWAAVAVCRTIAHFTGLPSQIKWPNDVLVMGLKVSGILVEQGQGTVIGIGLNVNQSADWLADAALPQAGSLASITGKSFDCGRVARRLIAHLDEEYERLCRGDRASLHTAWQESLGLIGKDVVVECLDGSYQGRLRHVGWESLCLEREGIDSIRVSPETVRHVYCRQEHAGLGPES
jgi:BirA family transcriptional regulator, biotin operon repressor / biotin---[acetyl-CoA-carboxylase] ligase